MGSEIPDWIMEFLLRKNVPNQLIQTLLTKLPISHNNPRLEKSILLNSIKNAAVSDQTLLLLENIESLDKEQGNPLPDSMKKAFCAAALECVVKVGRDKGKYMEAVERVWREIIGGLENRESLLVTEELCQWRDEVEASLWDDAVRMRLFQRKDDAAGLLQQYVEEALLGFGQPFLEFVAKVEREKKEGTLRGGESEDLASSLAAGTKKGEEIEPENDSGQEMEVNMETEGKERGPEIHSDEEVHVNMETEGKERGPEIRSDEEVQVNMETEGKERRPEIRSDEEVHEAKEKGHESHCGGDGQGVLKKKKPVRFKRVATGYKRSKGRLRIGYSEEDSVEYGPLPTPEVDKVQEALKTSSMELKALVKDPLPDALEFAATLTIEKERVQVESNTVVEKQNGKQFNAPNPPVEEVVEPPSVMLSTSNQNNVSKPSLMERNKTAQTYEWDDFSDGSPDGTSNRRMFHLDTAERKLASPLKKYETTKFSRRRQLKKWSLEEEDALRDGVQKFGKGSWKLILNSKRDIFVERTEVDLKDKWRNMTK